MALAAYDIFREIGQKVIIDYMPLCKNEVLQFFPKKRPLKIYEIKERLKLIEYLMSYGFKIQNEDKFPTIRDKAISRRETSRWILNNYERLKGLLGFLYAQLGEKRKMVKYSMTAMFDRPLSEIERELLNKQRFKVRDQSIMKELAKDEIIYLTGGWFEEYIFNEVYDLVRDDILDDAMIGIKIESLSGAVNELDIAFIKDNVFYYIECKTLGEGRKEKDIISEEVYKKGAISTLLGKGERRAFICTTLSHIKESLSSRARDYGIEILPIEQIRDFKNTLTGRFS